MPNDISQELLVGIIVNLIFLSLTAIVKWLLARYKTRNPLYRRKLLAFIVLLYAATSAAMLVRWTEMLHGLALVLPTVVLGWVLYSELHQFWRLGLVSSDTQIRSGIDCAKALAMCTNSLDFLGIGAAKLTPEEDAFERAIARCVRPGQPIRFLLSRPDYAALQDMALMAGQDSESYQKKVRLSLHRIADLKKRYDDIEVRFYRDFPAFRLMFVNDTICLASHYVLGKGTGSELPQLHLIRGSTSRDVDSLYFAFRMYFDKLWKRSKKWDFREHLD